MSLATKECFNLICRVIAAIGGQPDFSQLTFTINDSKFFYGAFINAVISFVIIAAVIYFFVVVPVNALMERRKSGEEPEVEAPSEDVLLLQEIRDLLRQRTV